MKVKTDKKGFTLIELLAVIVVLALIMILAVPGVLTAMNNSKKKTFQLYGTRLVNKAIEAVESERLLGSSAPRKYNNNPCYQISDLGITSQGSYQGFVLVIPSDLVDANGKNLTEYKVYLTDNTFAYNGTDYISVQGDANAIKTSAEDIAAVKTALNSCSASTPTPSGE